MLLFELLRLHLGWWFVVLLGFAICLGVVVVFAGCALCVLRVWWFWRCSVDLLLELYGFGLAVHCLCY